MADANIDALKQDVNLKTWQLVLLSLATIGIYNLVWLFLATDHIQKRTAIKVVGRPFLFVMAFLFAWAGVFSKSVYFELAVLSSVISASLLVCYILWAFKARRALQRYALENHQLTLKMNRFYTFLFTLYYINYCINDFPIVLQKPQQ